MGSTISTGFINGSINGMQVNSSFPCNSNNFSNRSSRNVSYLAIHYTGNSQVDSAKNNCRYFQSPGRNASAHLFVDDNSIYQSVELRDVAWAIGCKQGYKMDANNNNSISVEMCCTAGNGYVSEKTQINAAYVMAYLCKLIRISASQVDTYVIRHYDAVKSNKSCPAQYVSDPKQFTQFKTWIKNILNTGSYNGNPSNTPNPSNSSSTTLKVGSRGEDVKTMQNMLNACGFNCGTPDGIFGSGTETAVKSMQKHLGITQDGVYGATSKSKLESMYNTNGLANSSVNGIWYYNKHGRPDTSFTGLAQNTNGWFYIKNGQVDFSYNGLVKNNQGWWIVQKGKVNFNYNGLAKNEYGWWAIHKGKVDFNYNGFESNDQGMWYCEKGKITFEKTDVIKDSKTGIWYNVIKSKVTPGITVAKNVNGWWYIDKNGKVDFNFNGLAKNQYGTWVIEKGKVNFNYNGKYTYNGKNYNIKNGKVI